MPGVGSSPALATCETSHVLHAGVSGGFPGVLPFRPTFQLARLYEWNNVERHIKLNKKKKKKNRSVHEYNNEKEIMQQENKSGNTFVSRSFPGTVIRRCHIVVIPTQPLVSFILGTTFLESLLQCWYRISIKLSYTTMWGSRVYWPIPGENEAKY